MSPFCPPNESQWGPIMQWTLTTIIKCTKTAEPFFKISSFVFGRKKEP